MGNKTISIKRGCFNFQGAENFVKKVNNLKAGQIKDFTLEDIEFNGTLSINPVSISEVAQEFVESNFVPLDIYSGQSLYQEIKNDLGFAWDVYNKALLSKIYFVGSALEKKDSKYRENDPIENAPIFYLCLSYPDNKFSNPVLSVCKNDKFDLAQSCLAVFKKSFIEKEKIRIKEAAKEKRIRPWPTITECQTTVIRRLQEENDKLNAKCKELEKANQELQDKYDQDVYKIIKPQLSAETIDLLCKRICDFNLGTRIIRALETYETIYLFQLICWKKSDLKKLPQISSISIKRIENFLNEHDLTFGTNFFHEERNYFWRKVKEK